MFLRTTRVPSDIWSARESPLAAVEPFLIIPASLPRAAMDPEIFFGSGCSVFFDGVTAGALVWSAFVSVSKLL